MRLGFAALAVAGACAFGGAQAGAATLFQSVDDLSVRPDVPNLCTGCFGRQQAYEGMRLSTKAHVTDIDLVVRAFAGVCCFYDNKFFVKVYDGAPDDDAAPLIYSHRIFPYASGHAPEDELTEPGVLTGWDTAIVSFRTPGLLLQADHDYTFSFVDEDFHIAVFRTGDSPLYIDGGPLHDMPPRGKFGYTLPDGSTNTDGAAGFRLNGVVAGVPEPASWAFAILGLTIAGLGLRCSRRLQAA